ncbi:uncharacterized protein [Equus przewalskii]|uniref:Uncharacterized protein n=1 Tax=Equus przewalskii TaxID=9798 RepID=A0ABM4PAP4_EQUPR
MTSSMALTLSLRALPAPTTSLNHPPGLSVVLLSPQSPLLQNHSGPFLSECRDISGRPKVTEGRAAEPGAKILNSQLWACSPPHQRPQAGVDSSGHSPHYSSGSSSSQKRVIAPGVLCPRRRREGLAQAGKAPGEDSLTAVTLSPGECGDSAGLAGGGTGSRLSSREQVVEPLLWKPVSTSIKAYPVLGESNELRHLTTNQVTPGKFMAFLQDTATQSCSDQTW